jgi:hypothetical protein
MAETPSIERIIANTINDTARGDPDAMAAHIVTALGEAGYRILPANGVDDAALGSQPFDELTPEMRPQDTHGKAGIGGLVQQFPALLGNVSNEAKGLVSRWDELSVSKAGRASSRNLRKGTVR